MTKIIFTPDFIATLLGEGGKIFLPTKEQREVIESPRTGAVLVVAGAGSGKTETIANRVVWLVANGFAQPGEILGLTFTRKAAGELADRVRNRLLTFVERADEKRLNRELTAAQDQQIQSLKNLLEDSMEFPEVSTYNSFAVGIVQEFGGVIGIDGNTTLLDEASAWNLAREIVTKSNQPGLAATDYSINSIIDQVLSLDSAVHENLSTFAAVKIATQEFAKIIELPRSQKELDQGTHGANYADITASVNAIMHTPLVAELAEIYAAEKSRRGLLEYSDQVFLALRTLEGSPTAKQVLTKRSKFVLLDEIQDTSVAQTRLLAQVFRGASVMGVGDPNQSIFGWRGASSDSLAGFHNSFEGDHQTTKVLLSLTTSWRNSQNILQAANLVSEPLREATKFAVPQLNPATNAAKGTVETAYLETLNEEAEEAASWIKAKREEQYKSNKTYPSAAIIFRKRKDMSRFSKALIKQGVPSRIVGLGGLLTTPEITDIVSALRVIWYADAGSELIRVLSGPKFALGVADLKGLRNLANFFDKQDSADQNKHEFGARQVVTIVDALDRLIDIKDQKFVTNFISQEGLKRLNDAALLFRSLRKQAGGDLIELIQSVEEELLLDIELEVKTYLQDQEVGSARSNINYFIDEVRNFITASERSDLRSLLLWLDRTQQDDNLAEHVYKGSADEVQLITVHSAKGLEWDIVVTPRLSEGEFPSSPKAVSGWLRAGELPDECRGDRNTRPNLAWQQCATQQEVRQEIELYKAANREAHLAEEMRLIYVALTRARHSMLLTGSFWASKKTPNKPSKILSEIAEKVAKQPLPAESSHEESPAESDSVSYRWPQDALGSRRAQVTRAANTVKKLIQDKNEHFVEVDPTVQLLLAEDQTDANKEVTSAIPDRMNASAFHDFIDDPINALRQRIRPVPQRPYRQTRIGNVFHEWVQRRTTTAFGTKLELSTLEKENELLTAEDREQVGTLINNFEKSRWSQLQPSHVEIEITMPFAGRRVVCKLDAVYEIEDRVEIVDWKTGRPPKTKQEKAERFLQLDLYRLAYASYSGRDVDEIDATLFYVNEAIEISATEAKTREELEALWEGAILLLSRPVDIVV